MREQVSYNNSNLFTLEYFYFFKFFNIIILRNFVIIFNHCMTIIFDNGFSVTNRTAFASIVLDRFVLNT